MGNLKVIGGEKRGFHLGSPKGEVLRPTSNRVRKALFDILAGRIRESWFLDLFAGTGAVGIEALSRGASRCLFIEENPLAARVIQENVRKCGFEDSAEILKGRLPSALSLVEKRGISFDLVFVDPPYESPAGSSVLRELGAGKILKRESCVVVEHRRTRPPLNEPGSLTLMRTVDYGDTALSFFGLPGTWGATEELEDMV